MSESSVRVRPVNEGDAMRLPVDQHWLGSALKRGGQAFDAAHGGEVSERGGAGHWARAADSVDVDGPRPIVSLFGSPFSLPYPPAHSKCTCASAD